MQSTPLSTVLSRMNRWPDAENTEEQFKVRDLDSALREQTRSIKAPWTLVKGSLRVFDEVLEYPVASGHDELAYIDRAQLDSYADTARFYNTSIQQFYEMVNSTRNLISEIWDEGTKMLGINYDGKIFGSKTLSQAEDVDEYTTSDDASAEALDNVNFKRGNGSIRFTVTNSSGMAVIRNVFTAFSDTKYRSKYQFRWVYLGGIPTSIDLRFQTDDNNYLTDNVTTQFSGQAFKANQWNLVAIDLNTATEVGSFDSSSIASEMVILNDAPSGTYYLDESNLREWELMDYWYYSFYNVKTLSSSTPDQEFLFNDSEVYSTDSEIVGDHEWVDIIMYDALLMTINEKENGTIYQEIKGRREKAWNDFSAKYPSMVPKITTLKYRFDNNPGGSGIIEGFVR